MESTSGPDTSELEERIVPLASNAVLHAFFEDEKPIGKGKIRLADGAEIHGYFIEGKLNIESEVAPLPENSNISTLLEEAFQVNADETYAEDQLIITFPQHPEESAEDPIANATKGKMALGLLLSGRLNEGILDGIGKVIFPCGKLIHGQFVEGFMHGYAVVILPDGTIRQGEFKNNVLHGAGRITLPSGHTIQGIFNQGKLVIETI